MNIFENKCLNFFFFISSSQLIDLPTSFRKYLRDEITSKLISKAKSSFAWSPVGLINFGFRVD